MTLPWITVLTFAAVVLLVFGVGMLMYDWIFRYRMAVHDRIKELAPDSIDDQSVSLFKDIKRLRSEKRVHALTWKERLQQMIEQAGMYCPLPTFAAWCVGSGIAGAVLGLFGSRWLALVTAPLGAAVPLVVIYARRHVRTRRLSRQLPEVFQMISRAVRAGQTVPSALKIIAEDFEPPVSDEFALCYEQQNLGMSRESALRKLAVRTGIMELQMFVVALLVQAKSGGDLVELLDNLAAMIRKRLKLKDRVRALTGEGRMQALLLLVLPVVALVGILILAPEYSKALFERPWILAGTLVAQGAGAFWVHRIVNFPY